MFNRLPFGVARFRFHRAMLFVFLLVAVAGCGGGASSTMVPQMTAGTASGVHRATQSTTAAAVLAINVGGPAVGTFAADIDGQGGTVYSVTAAIDTSAAEAAPAAVYQTQRYGQMTYTLPNLTAGAAYTVRLHFAETYFGVNGRPGAGQRLFNVALNGTAALTNFDVYAAAGAADAAVVRDLSTTASATGQIVLKLSAGAANNPMLSGIEVIPVAPAATAPPATPSPSPSPSPAPSAAVPLVSINVGGPAAGGFSADMDGQGGTIGTSADAVDVTAAHAAPAVVYATQRYGGMTYTIPGLTASAAYTVRLHFDEQHFGADGRAGGVGSRKFNVAINGAAVLTNFDVFAAAGKANKAVVVDTPVSADANGKVTIALTNGSANNAMLSAIQILAMSGAAPTPTPTPAPTATPYVGSETARSSDAFVDATGINVHLSYAATLYGQQFPVVQSLLVNAHLRHVRDGSAVGQTSICNEDATLAAAGIHFDVIMPKTATDLTAWLACTGSAAETIEGLNEWDTSGDPSWASTDRSTELAAFAAVPQLPLLAPSLTSEADYTTLGSMPNVAYGNSHAYFAGRNPGTPGWGSTDAFGTYGSLAFSLAIAAQDSPGKAVVMTETGYSETSDMYAVPAVTKARYILRTLLGNWNAGVPRTYLYELADEGPAPFSHYGIVDGSGNPKPAYVALSALLGHLMDQGTSFTPGTLNYAFSATSTVRHTLLQKRNGTYELIFWNEVPEWDPNANATVAAPAQTVQVTFGAPPSALVQSTFADAGTLTTTALTSQVALTLSAGAWPTIIDITP